MLEQLKLEVYEANMEVERQNLIKYTWGNVSGADHEKKLFVIKPSGIPYEELKVEDMVVCDFDGNVVEGKYNPSSDTNTHAVLYSNFPELGGIVHTHSPWATSWAQAGKDVPVYGTTHADTFYGDVPCARFLSQEEIDLGYEWNTGIVIVETFKNRDIGILDIPAVLLQGHGPFTWGKTPADAVMNSVVLEEVCKMNFYTQSLNPDVDSLPKRVLDKHYLRKHGKDAYYGQKGE